MKPDHVVSISSRLPGLTSDLQGSVNVHRGALLLVTNKRDSVSVLFVFYIWFYIPILGLANAPIVETKFLELAMSLLDFSPRYTPWYFLDFTLYIHE